jgi:hypothetical protein
MPVQWQVSFRGSEGSEVPVAAGEIAVVGDVDAIWRALVGCSTWQGGEMARSGGNQEKEETGCLPLLSPALCCAAQLGVFARIQYRTRTVE